MKAADWFSEGTFTIGKASVTSTASTAMATLVSSEIIFAESIRLATVFTEILIISLV